ncbi:hypothetical protein WMY93_018339 [Mugilogobius chulae]|uniref:DUF4455 domain-containing protein n=1 Tax=Mugilogobius chulae TaxID=88201 RepID=A0AAW0NNK8_9GOBI
METTDAENAPRKSLAFASWIYRCSCQNLWPHGKTKVRRATHSAAQPAVTSGSSSDVIKRMSEKKEAKHQETLLQLDTELTAISKMFESHVRTRSEELLISLRDIDMKLDNLSHKMEQAEDLKSHSLQDMHSLWAEVEEKVKLKATRIREFYFDLCQNETKRTSQLQDVLKNRGGQLEKISFLPLSDIQRLLHSKTTMVNQSLLANRRSICQLRLHLQVENLQRESVLHQRWEDCVEQWRNNRVHQIVQDFSELCSKDFDEELFTEDQEILKIQQRLKEASFRRCEMVSNLRSLVPPTCSFILVSDWFDQLKSIDHQIDDVHAELVRCLHNCFEQIWKDRLEEVHRCEKSLRDLQLTEAQVTNIVQSDFLPLIGQSQSKADKILVAFDVNCDSLSRHSLSTSSSVFGLMHQASLLWEEHCSNLKNIETKVQQDVKELRLLQKEQLQRKTFHLDEQLSALRQESTEEALNTSLNKALLELRELHDSCRQHLLDQNTVLDRLTALYVVELQNYCSRISAFFHLSSSYTPSLEEFGAALSDLDLSLKAAITKDESSESSTDTAQNQVDNKLLNLCNMNSYKDFSSSRGLSYSGPSFSCKTLELEVPLRNLQLEVFPVALLLQTLSRVRSLCVDHMEQHFHDGVLSGLSLLSHLKHEALTERDVKLQQLSAQHVHRRIFQPRLVSLTLSSLNTDLKKLLESVGKKNQTFSTTVSSFENSLRSVDSLQSHPVVCWSSGITERERKKLDKVIKKSSSVLGCPLDSVREDVLSALESSFSDRLIHPRCVKERFHRSFLSALLENLSSILKDYLDKHMMDTRTSQSSFRKNVQAQLEQLKQATTRLLCSFRLFSEGGNFTSYEIKLFQKRLKKEMKKIILEEESIHDQLETCHSSSLQQVREVYSLQEKLTLLKTEFIFVEKTKDILRSTQIKIKAVECQAHVFSTLSVLSQMLHQQAQSLHFSPVSEEEALQEESPLPAHLSSHSSALQPFGSGGLHDDPLLGLIKSLNRYRAPASSEHSPKKGKVKVLDLFREEKRSLHPGEEPDHSELTGGCKRLGPDRSLRRILCDSFSSKVSALLWETSDVLMLALR